jgi:CheY-like chemotaxis protein
MSSINFKVIHAANGIEALEMARNHQSIDLILMDIKMPEMDGIEATKAIREFLPNIIIIAQSAYTHERDSALDSGCTDFISKPYTKEQLIQKVKQYIKDIQ